MLTTRAARARTARADSDVGGAAVAGGAAKADGAAAEPHRIVRRVYPPTRAGRHGTRFPGPHAATSRVTFPYRIVRRQKPAMSKGAKSTAPCATYALARISTRDCPARRAPS